MWLPNDNPKTADALIVAENIIPAHTRIAIPAETIGTAHQGAVAVADRLVVRCVFCNRTENDCDMFDTGEDGFFDGGWQCWYHVAQTLIDDALFFDRIKPQYE